MTDYKDKLAIIFSALSDLKRLTIIEMLARKEMNCTEIADALNVSLPTVTHHLDILIRAGVVEKRREGTWKYGILRYDVIEDALKTLRKHL